MWLRVCSIDHAPLTVMPYIFFFKIKNCLNDDLFISCNDRIGKMLHNICISAVAISLRWATCGPWASCFTLSLIMWYLASRLCCSYASEKSHSIMTVDFITHTHAHTHTHTHTLFARLSADCELINVITVEPHLLERILDHGNVF